MVGRILSVATLALFVSACASSPPPVTAPPPMQAAPPAPAPKNAVHARVLDETGKPLVEAWARALGPNNKIEAEAKADAKGELTLVLDGSRDAIRLVQLEGANHRSTTIAIATESLPVDVDVRLGTWPASAAGELKMALAPQPRTLGPMSPLVKVDAAHVEVPSTYADGEYPFQIFGPEHAVVADGFARVEGKKARVAFELDKLPPPDAEAIVAWKKSASSALTNVWRTMDRAHVAYEEKLHKAVKAGVTATEFASAYAWAEPKKELGEVARTHPNLVVRNAATIAYFSCGDFSSPSLVTDEERSMATKTIASLPPSDRLWGVMRPTVFAKVAAMAGETWKGEYVQRFVHENPDDLAVLMYVTDALKTAKDDPETARALVAITREPRFAHNMFAVMAARFDPSTVVAAGNSVPAFDVRALNGDKLDEKTRFSPKSFAKKVLLLDVWATWCAPCVAELPKIAELHAKYGKKLEILSVSIDDDATKVATFRKDKAHPMPWSNAVVPDDAERRTLAKSLGLPEGMSSVPFYVLVDPNGKIISASPRLDGQNLESAVASAVAAAK